jgi:hypothetical protein
MLGNILLSVVAITLSYYLLSRHAPVFKGVVGFLTFICFIPGLVFVVCFLGSSLVFNGGNASSGTGFGLFLMFILLPLAVVSGGIGTWLLIFTDKQNENKNDVVIDIKGHNPQIQPLIIDTEKGVIKSRWISFLKENAVFIIPLVYYLTVFFMFNFERILRPLKISGPFSGYIAMFSFIVTLPAVLVHNLMGIAQGIVFSFSPKVSEGMMTHLFLFFGHFFSGIIFGLFVNKIINNEN